MQDTYHDNKAVQALAPAVVAAAVTGTAIDLAGFDSALIVINTGALVGAGDFGVKLQESNTTVDGDFTDVPTADKLGVLPATLAANSAYRVGYIGSKRKRYVRVRAGWPIGLAVTTPLDPRGRTPGVVSNLPASLGTGGGGPHKRCPK